MTNPRPPRTEHLSRPMDNLSWQRLDDGGAVVTYMISEKPGSLLLFSRTTGVWTVVLGATITHLGVLENGVTEARRQMLEMMLGKRRTSAPTIDPTSHTAPMPRAYVPGPCPATPSSGGGSYVVTAEDTAEMDLRARTARWLESNGLPTRLAYNGLARVRTIS